MNRKEGMDMPKVALFVTCLSDTLFPSVGQATVELLEHLGCDVSFPFEQTCCGQPAYNSGYHEETKRIAKHMIETFEKADADYIVGPSGSCVMMMRDYPHLFKDDLTWKMRAEAHAAKTFELTQFIVDVLEVTDVGAKFPAKATYHASCHMTRLLGIDSAPGQLLKNVDGLTMLPLENVHNCCGFGGTFSVKMPDVSVQMVDEKVESILNSGAEVLIGADASCLMNIGGRLHKQGHPIKVMHIAEVLNEGVKQA